MAGEFIKPSSISPAVIGTIANPDDYNKNIAGQSKGSIVPIDIDGNFADGDLGDETLATNGALINNVKLREGGLLKYYNSSGAFQKDVNLDQAQFNLLGQTLLPKRIEFLNSIIDLDHDMTFKEGSFIFDDGTGQAVSTNLEKRIDAAWSAGNNAGGLDAGSVAANLTYHMFVIHNPATQTSDYLFSLSATSPTLPSGYTKKKRLGALRTDGSANIRRGTYYFNPDGTYDFLYDFPVLDVNTTGLSISAVTYSLTVPTGIKVKANINSYAEDGAIDFNIYISSLDSNDLAPSQTLSPLSNLGAKNSGGVGTNATKAFNSHLIHTNTSAVIRARASTAITKFLVATLGWTDFDL